MQHSHGHWPGRQPPPPPIPPEMNGAKVEPELLFHVRNTVVALIDLRHGMDILPERIAQALQALRAAEPKPTATKLRPSLKSYTDLLQAVFYLSALVLLVVVWLTDRSLFRDAILAAISKV